jgi:hypothetical protein
LFALLLDAFAPVMSRLSVNQQCSPRRSLARRRKDPSYFSGFPPHRELKVTNEILFFKISNARSRRRIHRVRI